MSVFLIGQVYYLYHGINAFVYLRFNEVETQIVVIFVGDTRSENKDRKKCRKRQNTYALERIDFLLEVAYSREEELTAQDDPENIILKEASRCNRVYHRKRSHEHYRTAYIEI